MDTYLSEAARRSADLIWLAVWQHAFRSVVFYRKVDCKVVGPSMFAIDDHVSTGFVITRTVERTPWRPKTSSW